MNNFLAPLEDLYNGVDPHWRNVVFLLKPTAGSGSTSFVENSRFAGALSVSGNTIKIVDNMFPPDGRYIYIDGSGDRLSRTDTKYVLGRNDFTIEFWVMFISGGSQYGRILQIGPNSTLGSLFIVKNSTSPGYLIQLGASGGYETVALSSTAFPEFVWTHFALVREEAAAARWRVYINGILHATNSALAAKNLTASALNIGANSALAEYYKGCLAEIRITNGVARYQGTFIPQRFCPVM